MKIWKFQIKTSIKKMILYFCLTTITELSKFLNEQPGVFLNMKQEK